MKYGSGNRCRFTYEHAKLAYMTMAPLSAVVAFHPALHADWLVLRRAGFTAFLRIISGPAVLLVSCVAIACGDLYGGYESCLTAGALLALGGSYALAHGRLLDASERWRFGWCGALPTTRGASTRTLCVVATAAWLASLVFAAATLLGVSIPAPHRADWTWALTGIWLGLTLGMAVAMARALRANAAVRARHQDEIRVPVFAWPWLNHPRLPHWLDWQRRAALVRWRRSGSFAIGVVLLAAPSLRLMVGLALLVLAWAWLTVVMRTSAHTSTAAVHLLRAVPLNRRRARAASLRYPIFAAACALVPVAIAAIWGGSVVIALVWVACAGAASTWPLVSMFRATRPVDTSA